MANIVDFSKVRGQVCAICKDRIDDSQNPIGHEGTNKSVNHIFHLHCFKPCYFLNTDCPACKVRLIDSEGILHEEKSQMVEMATAINRKLLTGNFGFQIKAEAKRVNPYHTTNFLRFYHNNIFEEFKKLGLQKIDVAKIQDCFDAYQAFQQHYKITSVEKLIGFGYIPLNYFFFSKMFEGYQASYDTICKMLEGLKLPDNSPVEDMRESVELSKMED